MSAPRPIVIIDTSVFLALPDRVMRAMTGILIEHAPFAAHDAIEARIGLAHHARDDYGYMTMAEQHALSRMTLTLVLEAVPHRVERDAETGRFFAINDDLHTIAEGDTQAEADANFHEALVGLVDYCLESGLPLPKALVEHRTVATA